MATDIIDKFRERRFHVATAVYLNSRDSVVVRAHAYYADQDGVRIGEVGVDTLTYRDELPGALGRREEIINASIGRMVREATEKFLAGVRDDNWEERLDEMGDVKS